MSVRPKEVHYPKLVHAFRRGERHIYCATARGVVVSVNQQGARILDLCSARSAVSDIVAACVGDSGCSVEEAQPRVERFIGQMLEAGFLLHKPDDSSEAPIGAAEELEVRLGLLYLHMTNACNLRCWYCYNQDYRESRQPGDDLTLPQLREMIEEFAAQGGDRIIFTGGEPTLSPHLLPLAEIAVSLGIGTTLLTNGTRCTPQTAPDICRNFEVIIVSLDSVSAAGHDANRGKGTHSRTVAGIRALSGFLAEHPDVKTALYCRPVISGKNIEGLEGYPAFILNDLGCHGAIPNGYLPVAGADFAGDDFVPFEKLLPRLIEFEAEMERLNGRLPESVLKLRPMGRCGAGSSRVSIAPDGTIYPCQCLHFAPLAIGNVKRGGLKRQIEASEVARFFRRFHYSQIKTCKDCALGPICGGGCRAMAYSYCQDLKAHNDVYCPFFRQELEFGLWMKTLRKEVDEADVSADRQAGGPLQCV